MCVCVESDINSLSDYTTQFNSWYENQWMQSLIIWRFPTTTNFGWFEGTPILGNLQFLQISRGSAAQQGGPRRRLAIRRISCGGLNENGDWHMDEYDWTWMKPFKISGFLLCLESCFIPPSKPDKNLLPAGDPNNGQSTSRRAGRPGLTYGIHCVLTEVVWIVDAFDCNFVNIWILEMSKF